MKRCLQSVQAWLEKDIIVQRSVLTGLPFSLECLDAVLGLCFVLLSFEGLSFYIKGKFKVWARERATLVC